MPGGHGISSRQSEPYRAGKVPFRVAWKRMGMDYSCDNCEGKCSAPIYLDGSMKRNNPQFPGGFSHGCFFRTLLLCMRRLRR